MAELGSLRRLEASIALFNGSDGGGCVQAAFVLPRKLLTEAARNFVQAPRGHQSATPGVSLLDKIEASCRRNVQLPRQLRDWDQFAFLQRR